MKNNRWYGDIGKIWTRSYFTVARWIWIFLDVWCLFDLVLFPVVFTVLFIVRIARGRSLHPAGEFSFQTWLPRITSGGSRGGARPPALLFLDETEAQGAEKSFLEDPPPPLYPFIWRSGSAVITSLPRRRSYGFVTQSFLPHRGVGTRDEPLRTFAWEAILITCSCEFCGFFRIYGD